MQVFRIAAGTPPLLYYSYKPAKGDSMKHVTPIKSLFAVAFAFAMSVALTAEARSITSVERVAAAGTMSLNVTFEAGESGDAHALYIAYDTEDKGDNIANWAALQRGCVVDRKSVV